MDVVEASPAITADTVLLSDDGPIRFGDTKNSLDTLLVSDTSTSIGRSGLTILAVDQKGRMQGLVEQSGKSMQFSQGVGNSVVMAEEEEVMMQPDWECGVGKQESLFIRHLEEDHHGHDHDVSYVQ